MNKSGGGGNALIWGLLQFVMSRYSNIINPKNEVS